LTLSATFIGFNSFSKLDILGSVLLLLTQAISNGFCSFK